MRREAPVGWTWRLQTSDGVAATDIAVPSQSSQSDAESWLGENWRELRRSGVAAVTLLDGTREVYGPMSLSEQ
jgi:hypothetical protein